MSILRFFRTGVGRIIGLALSLAFFFACVFVAFIIYEASMISFGGHRMAAQKTLAHHMALHEINAKFLACEAIPEDEDNRQICSVRLLDGKKNKITFTCSGFLLGAEGSCTQNTPKS